MVLVVFSLARDAGFQKSPNITKAGTKVIKLAMNLTLAAMMRYRLENKTHNTARGTFTGDDIIVR